MFAACVCTGMHTCIHAYMHAGYVAKAQVSGIWNTTIHHLFFAASACSLAFLSAWAEDSAHFNNEQLFLPNPYLLLNCSLADQHLFLPRFLIGKTGGGAAPRTNVAESRIHSVT